MSEKRTMTIDYVDPTVRDPWTGGKDGKPMWFPECRFSDGSIGSGFAFSATAAQEWIDAFQSLRDTPTEFELEDNGSYNGAQKWKVKDFPGKPKSSGGGGGGRGGGGGMSHVHAGTLAAASVLGPILAKQEGELTPDLIAAYIQETADPIIEWLFNRRGGQANGSEQGDAAGGEGDAQGTSSAPAPAISPDDQMTLPQMRELRRLAKDKGIESNEEIAKAAGVGDFKDITKTDADLLIEAWSA